LIKTNKNSTVRKKNSLRIKSSKTAKKKLRKNRTDHSRLPKKNQTPKKKNVHRTRVTLERPLQAPLFHIQPLHGLVLGSRQEGHSVGGGRGGRREEDEVEGGDGEGVVGVDGLEGELRELELEDGDRQVIGEGGGWKGVRREEGEVGKPKEAGGLGEEGEVGKSKEAGGLGEQGGRRKLEGNEKRGVWSELGTGGDWRGGEGGQRVGGTKRIGGGKGGQRGETTYPNTVHRETKSICSPESLPPPVFPQKGGRRSCFGVLCCTR
jgi:hypothetical protein